MVRQIQAIASLRFYKAIPVVPEPKSATSSKLLAAGATPVRIIQTNFIKKLLYYRVKQVRAVS